VAVNQRKPAHNHTRGTAHCKACQINLKAERVGGVPWAEWCAALIKALGYSPKHPDVSDDDHLAELGVDRNDAVSRWVDNWTVKAFIKHYRIMTATQHVPAVAAGKVPLNKDAVWFRDQAAAYRNEVQELRTTIQMFCEDLEDSLTGKLLATELQNRVARITRT
jgi:hypothetical protein